MRYKVLRVRPFLFLLLLCCIGAANLRAAEPADLANLQSGLIKTNQQLRAVSKEIAAMELFLATYQSRTNVIIGTLNHTKAFERFASKTLRQNVLKTILSLGLATGQQTMDGFGGLSKAVGKYVFESLLNLGVDEATSAWSAPYRVKVRSFRDSSAELFPELRRINRLLQLEDSRVRNIAFARDGVDLGPKGLALWKVRNLRNEARAVIPSIELYVQQLEDTKIATENELSNLRPRRDELTSALFDIQACIREARQTMHRDAGSMARQTAEQALGSAEADAPPEVSAQEPEETPHQQYRKTYDAAALKLQNEWPGLLTQIHAKRLQYLSAREDLQRDLLSQIPDLEVAPVAVAGDQVFPSLRELILLHESVTANRDHFSGSNFESLIGQARTAIVALRTCLDEVAALEHRKEELELYAQSINAIYTRLVGGTPSPADDMVVFLNQLPSPDDFLAEFSTFERLQALVVIAEELDSVGPLIQEAIDIYAASAESLEAAFNLELQKRRRQFQELENAVVRFRDALDTCIAAAENWNNVLLNHDYGFTHGGQGQITVEKSNGEHIQIPAADFNRRGLMDDFSSPFAKNTTFAALHQSYRQLIDVYNTHNLVFTSSRIRLVESLAEIEGSGTADYPLLNSSFGSYDADWLDASLLEDTELAAPLPDLTLYDQVVPLLDRAVEFRTFRSLIYPGSPDDPDWIVELNRLQETLDQFDVAVPAGTVNQALDDLYALWQQFEPEDQRAFSSWVGNIVFFSEDQQSTHAFVNPPSAPPVITRQPSSATLTPDGKARLSVSASGDGLLLYAWAEMNPDFPNDPDLASYLGFGFRPYLDIEAGNDPASYFVMVSNGHFQSTLSDVVTVGQDMNASVSLLPEENQVASGGGSQMLQVTASSAALNWVARSRVSWIIIDGSGEGQGNGMVSYFVNPNDTGGPREGEIHIAGEIHTVLQDYTPLDFATWSQSNPGNAGDDMSGDGISQLGNFLMGTDPTRDNRDKKPSLQLEKDAFGNPLACIRYRRSKLATGVEIKLRMADALGQWLEITPPQVPDDEDGDSWVYLAEIPLSPDAPLGFFQVLTRLAEDSN